MKKMISVAVLDSGIRLSHADFKATPHRKVGAILSEVI